MELDRQQRSAFLETLWEQYRLRGRPDLPWRMPEKDGRLDPYKIMVSELMLQQTQVSRVIPKYEAFLKQFPGVQALAAASLGEVLRVWQGLGYNRRAKFLWQAAQAIVELKEFPREAKQLTALPGIGPNTAGAIVAYSFNEPVVFIETNIRTVYIHHFFHDQTGISDKEILHLVAQTLPHEEGKEQPDEAIHSLPGAKRKTAGLSHYREFYWALMDYGSYLKATVGNLNKASKHYAKQSKFHGSRRAIRGQVIRLLDRQARTYGELLAVIADERLVSVLADLVKEGMISQNKGTYSLD